MLQPHLVQYQGSKRKLASQIIQYFPPSVSRLVEPFCGTAAVSICAALENRAASFWLNDLNAPLAAMMEMCVQDPDGLSRRYEKIWQGQFTAQTDSVAYFFMQREAFNEQHLPEQMLFMLARLVKGAVRYNAAGQLNQSCDKRRFGTRPETVGSNARQISSLLKGKTIFDHQDYKEILKQCVPGDLVYMDPPYQGTSSSKDGRYVSGLDFGEFVEELYKLDRRGIDFILSYDGCTGQKTYGRQLPEDLGLIRIELRAGRSAQAVLLGRNDETTESLYLSRSLKACYEQACAKAHLCS